MSLKIYLTCSFCTKILNIPRVLPCGDSVCQNHLTEKHILKDNLIKCKTCESEFQVKNIKFPTNNLALKQLEDAMYLNETEKFLKLKIEESFRMYLNLHEQLHDAKIKLDLACFDHFQEIRRLIDLHREEKRSNSICAKNDNDEEDDNLNKISFEMIAQTQAIEETYLLKSANICDLSQLPISLKEDEEAIQTFIKEKFRNVNLTLDEIENLRAQQEETIVILKSKVC